MQAVLTKRWFLWFRLSRWLLLGDRFATSRSSGVSGRGLRSSSNGGGGSLNLLLPLGYSLLALFALVASETAEQRILQFINVALLLVSE